VKTQIWTAISAYVLVAIVRKRLEIQHDLYTILQILSLYAVEKVPLPQLLTTPAHTRDRDLVRNQLSLFNF